MADIFDELGPEKRKRGTAVAEQPDIFDEIESAGPDLFDEIQPNAEEPIAPPPAPKTPGMRDLVRAATRTVVPGPFSNLIPTGEPQEPPTAPPAPADPNTARRELLRKGVVDQLRKSGGPLVAPIVNTKMGQRLATDLASGAAGTTGSMAAAIPAAEQFLLKRNTVAGKFGQKVADNLMSLSSELMPDDPNFFDHLASGAASMAMFMVPGAGSGAIAANIPRMGVMAAKLAPAIGASVSAVLEAGTEAGGVYQEQIKKGFSPDVASKAAFQDFWQNALWVGLTNRFGVYGDQLQGLKKAIGSASLEGLQEAYQTILGSISQDEMPDWGEVVTALGVGAALGGPTGLAIDATRGTETPASPPTPNVPQRTNVTDETMGEKKSAYLQEKFPMVYDRIANTTAPVSDKELNQALVESATVGEEILLKGGTPEEANTAALDTFTKTITPALEKGGIAKLEFDQKQIEKAARPSIEDLLIKFDPAEIEKQAAPKEVQEIENDAIEPINLPTKKIRLKKSEVEAEARYLYDRAVQDRESKISPLEQFVKENGGIKTYRDLDGKKEEMEEYRNIPVRLRGTVAYDEMLQMARDNNVLPVDAPYSALYEELNQLQTRGEIPRWEDFVPEARRNLEYEKIQAEMAKGTEVPPDMAANYSAQRKEDLRVKAKAAAEQVIRANKIDDRVMVNLVDAIAVDNDAFKAGYGEQYDQEAYDILGVTYSPASKSRIQAVIDLAQGATESTGRHEAFHAVSNILLDKNEQNVIVQKYGDMEKAADAFGEFRKAKASTGDSIIDRVFQKIAQFLERLGNYVSSSKFSTAEDIFEAIDQGKFADRARRDAIRKEYNPAPARPELKNTNDAIEYGNKIKGDGEAIRALEAEMATVDAQREAAMQAGDMDNAWPLAFKHQFLREARDQAQGTLPSSGLDQYQAVYHGSPFEFDAFDLNKIGTGEGNQAYGWGLYFAGKKEVAEFYKKSIASQRGEASGKLYEVNIPEDYEFLNHDVLIADHSKALRAKLEKLNKDLKLKLDPYESTGEQFYGALSEHLGGDEKASRYLAANGIPGLKYLDQQSRGAAAGTSNYVIFDDSQIKIISQYSAKRKDDPNQMGLFDQNLQPTKEAQVAEPDRNVPGTATKPLTHEVKKTAPAKPAAGEVADVGEELWYNRRNFTKGITWDKVKDLNPTLKTREVVKTKIWERPNYEEFVDGGMQPLTAHIVKQIYDSIAAAPAVRGTATDEQMKSYMDGVAKVRDAVFAWAKDGDKQASFIKGLSDSAGRSLMYTVAANDLSMLDAVFPKGPNSRNRFRDNPEMNQLAILLGGNKLVEALQPGHSSARAALKAINEGWPAKREAWQMQFKIAEEKRGTSPSEFYVVRKATGRIMGTGFKTKQDAGEFAKTLVETKKGGTQPERRTLDRWERKGPSRRETGENIEPQRLMDTFGFRGVNYGNWVKADERQEFTNAAYDALSDLAELLRVPPKALSLNGLLGIAFGAQGRGGRAAAHFVPGVNEINLTKTAGAGALAHEWGHALDHYFGVQAGEGVQKNQRPYLTHHAEFLKPEDAAMLRPEILKAFSDIVGAMKRRIETQAEMETRISNQDAANQKRLDSWLIAIRDRFKNSTPAEKLDDALKQFDVIADRIRKGDSGSGYLPNGRSPMKAIPPAVAQIRDLYRSVTNQKLDAHYIDGLTSNAQHVAYTLKDETRAQRHTPTKMSTKYLAEATKLDKDKGGKAYWSTETELLARAFESYVLDRLKGKSQRNDYLTAPQAADDFIFPQGVDRNAINKAFDALIDGLKTKPTERGIALYSAKAKRKQDIIRVTMPSRAKQPKLYTERAALRRSLQRQSQVAAEVDRNAVERVNEIKTDLVQAIKDVLPETERGAFLDKVAKVETPEQAARVIEQARVRLANVMKAGGPRTISEKNALRRSLERQTALARQVETATKKELTSLKIALADDIQEHLPPAERGRFLKAVAKANTPRHLGRLVPRIDEVVEKVQRKTLINSIKREFQRVQASQSIAIDYRSRIGDIFKDIIFQKPRTSTLLRLNNLQKYLAERRAAGADTAVPDYVLEKLRVLTSTPLSEMPIATLEDIAGQMERLADLGRTKLRVRQEIDQLNKDRDLADIQASSIPLVSKELLQANPGEVLTMTEKFQNLFKKVQNGAQHLRLSITPMDVMFDMLDGMQMYAGANFRIFKSRVDSAYGNYLQSIDVMRKEIASKAKGLTEPQFRRIGTYAIDQQETGREKLYNNFGAKAQPTTTEEINKKAEVDQMIDSIKLTPAEMAFYKYMRSTLDRMRPQIAEAMKDIYNADLGEVEHYFPFMTDFNLEGETDIMDRMEMQMMGLKKNVNLKFTKERVGAGKQKVQLDSLEVFLRHMDDVAYLLNMGATTKYLGELANTTAYGEAVGVLGQRLVREWVDVVAKKGGGASNIRGLDILRRNMGAATLGFKLSTIMVQPGAINQGAAVIGSYAYRGAASITQRPWREFVLNNFPEVRARVGDDQTFLEFGGNTVLDRLQVKGFWALQQVDLLAASSVAAGAYQKFMHEKGLPVDFANPNKEGVEYAQRVVRRTQASSAFKDSPLALSRGRLTGNRSVDRMIFQFQNFALNEWSLLTHEMYDAGFRSGRKAQGVNVLLWTLLASASSVGVRMGTKELINAITNYDNEEDPFKKQYLRELLGKVPIMNQFVSMMNYGGAPSPVLDTLSKAAKSAGQLAYGKKQDTKTRGAIGLVGAVGRLTGLAGTAQLEELSKRLLTDPYRKKKANARR